ncbi:hypothetical protein JIN85_02780 [Luteolibacter pohnpeiensis]|uniref:Uncharacterized protein n=1 Tax=Luteolibacter pohnpeiensis TaxID=454153 RepID=A0A934S7W7_9BACT|nr:hypothetical protein [Luteolibacter pohnpeiensis]MBK1881322.1 hypothetical protein [Luteolibacter pohnpeiensis]
MNDPHDKRNDGNWAMQAIILPLGGILLLYGCAHADGFWRNFSQYWAIYMGMLWLMLGLMHRLLWKAKAGYRDALDLYRSVHPESERHSTSKK